MKTIGVIVIAMIALLALTGSVMADGRVNATPEIQGISTTTTIDAYGTATDTVSLAWSTSNIANPVPPLLDSEVIYTTTYNQKLNAVDGFTTYTKGAAISTANQIGNGQNVQMDTNLQYVADGTGRATNEESIVLDGAANERVTSTLYLCPFASSASSTVPQYCNYVAAGSKIDTTQTSTVTQAKESFVGVISDYPVTMGYSIAAKGFGTGSESVPMLGSATANVVVDLKEARNQTGLTETLVYKETSSASGQINGFSKVFAYQSGMILH